MMGTTYQALKDFAENLREIQMVARVSGVGAIDYELIRPTLNRAVTDCQAQMMLIRTSIQSSPTDDERKAAIDSLIVAAFDDTAAIVANPSWTEEGTTMGKLGQVPPSGWAEVIKAAQGASKSLIRLFKYIIGATAAGGALLLLGPWAIQRITDPYGFKSGLDVWTGAEAACAEARARAGTDPEKLAGAEAYCAWVRQRIKANLPGSCGPLDTPYGTLIGLVLGIGFGWAGMRKVMGL